MTEGKTQGITSPKDRSGLKDRWIGLSEEQINGLESEFILKAQKKHLHRAIPSPSKWFNPPFLFRVHKDMFFSVWEWAGKQRQGEKNIGIKSHFIQDQLFNLCQDVAFWNTNSVELTVLEQSCLIHHRLVSIHPFEDGNGRFSRLIADRYLKSHACHYPMWPDNLHREADARKYYIEALREADLGNLELLLAFSKKFIPEC